MHFLGAPHDPRDPGLGVTGVMGAAIFCVSLLPRTRANHHPLKRMGLPIADVAKATGLTAEDIVSEQLPSLWCKNDFNTPLPKISEE